MKFKNNFSNLILQETNISFSIKKFQILYYQCQLLISHNRSRSKFVLQYKQSKIQIIINIIQFIFLRHKQRQGQSNHSKKILDLGISIQEEW
ncbi:unnamed protein product [Paramecium pentaurelia]|uniref:Uncharacterized protein n=1 Tax=Paramecium pentaurelia TaxID=43138 RepID=A0A8S1S1X7_9CILI|nr:unnamed protein product [Paramecium pentaurelia]